VKCWLEQTQEKLTNTLIEWIIRQPHFINWQDGNDTGLLCVRGDPGKGKTMISIGLIEQLSFPPDEFVILSYFFCQATDSRLNSVEAIIKSLILQLVNQDKELGESVRTRWDPINNRFHLDLSSWRELWDILWEMLGICKRKKIYLIIDGLDECQGKQVTDFLECLVQNGLDHPSKVKWLLTIQTMGDVDRKLLASSQGQLFSLKLDSSKVISEAVKSYAIIKAADLDHRHNYGQTLLGQIETEFIERAEDTFLWIFLACKSLEHVPREGASHTIQLLPPGLHSLNEQRFNQLREGDPVMAKGCVRILKVMTLAYQPLNLTELAVVSGLSEGLNVRLLVDHCSPFLQMRETRIEFVHHSVRKHLSAMEGKTSLDCLDAFGHGDIALNCLSYLSKRLKVNLANLPEPSSRREVVEGRETEELLESMRYAATFWVKHLESAQQTDMVTEALAEQGKVSEFLYGKCLEWLEYLILLDELPYALQGFGKLAALAAVSDKTMQILGPPLTEHMCSQMKTNHC
jgi:hypothetical protein